MYTKLRIKRCCEKAVKGIGVYKYTALSGSGKTVRGSMRADSLSAFYAELKRGDLYCMRVRETSDSVPLWSRVFGKASLPPAEMAVFCRQMASMTAYGVTINRCLQVLYGQATHVRARFVLSRLYEEVQKGNQLSSAMSETDGAFEPLVINMIRAGENSGMLERSFARLADHYEREIKLRRKTMLALLYPIILLAVTLGVVVVLFVIVLPSFITMFQSLESLPWYTRSLIWISDFLVHRWYIAIGIILGFTAGIAALHQNASFKLWRDAAILRIPFIGKLQTRIVCARFCRIFASLYTSGVQILTALELSGNVIGNSFIKEALGRAAAGIKAGTSLATALQKEKLFPQMMITMLMVGEESGEIDEMLLKTSDYYDNEADAATQRLIGILQPVMIVVLGLIVAFVMISVLQPIYSMYRNI